MFGTNRAALQDNGRDTNSMGIKHVKKAYLFHGSYMN
jgi:hypothetical protein